MARVIFEYDAAIGMVSDANGRSVIVGCGLVPFESLEEVVHKSPPLLPVKPPKPTAPQWLNDRQDKFLKLALELRKSGFSHEQIVKLKIQGMI